MPQDTTVRNAQSNVAQVSILRSNVVKALPLLLLAGFVLPLTASIILLARKRIRRGIFLLLGTCIVSFLAMVIGIVYNLGPWTMCDQTTDADGTQYYFIDSSFLQGPLMAIARMKSSGLFYETMDVFGTTNGDSPRSYLLVVRPTPVKPVDYGALYSTPTGLLVGLRYDNRCYMVYDISNKRFYGHDDVEKLSPFMLLDEKSQLHAPDEADILKTIGSGHDMGLPTHESLNQALTHPNPAVRQSATNILKAMKQ